jgi:hypothetical protein
MRPGLAAHYFIDKVGRYLLMTTLGIGVVSLLLTTTSSGQTPEKPSHFDQRLLILSAGGAACSIKQDGKLIEQLVTPIITNEYSAKIITLHMSSQDDIVVTCSKEGYDDQSRVLSYGPETWIADHAPCPAPEHASTEEIRADCANYNSATTSTRMEFPEATSLLLKRREVK